MKNKTNDTPQNADGTYTVELDPDLVERLEKLITRHEKQMEENKHLSIWKDGVEYANLEEYHKLTER
jgi:hypothetical protein